jgi:hypothetical protein
MEKITAVLFVAITVFNIIRMIKKTGPTVWDKTGLTMTGKKVYYHSPHCIIKNLDE